MLKILVLLKKLKRRIEFFAGAFFWLVDCLGVFLFGLVFFNPVFYKIFCGIPLSTTTGLVFFF